MSMAPVILFVYNRLDKVKNCLEALECNSECNQTDLYIFADGFKEAKDAASVIMVRDYIKKVYISQSRFLTVNLIESAYNKGLSNSIIDGVSEVIERYGKAIVVEDDLVVSKDFLEYMNDGLNYYENIASIGSISAYTSPFKELKQYKKDIFITRKGECWGWGTWKDRWQQVDWNVTSFEEYKANTKMRREFDSIGYGLDYMLCRYMEGTLDTWAVRWCYHLYRNNLLTVYPKISRTRNSGLDGSGTHCTQTDRFMNDSIGADTKCNFQMLKCNYKLERAMHRYEEGKQTLFSRVIGRAHKLIIGFKREKRRK